MLCILITGIPASGKSFFSNYLSNYLDIPYLSKDDIKEKLFDIIGFKSREEKMGLNDVATSTMLYCAEQLMKRQRLFILESNFEKKNKLQIKELINQYKYKCVTILLTGDYFIIYQRLIMRNKMPERHPGHVINDYFPRQLVEKDFSALSFEQFVNEILSREMDEFDFGNFRFKIDTTNIKEVQWETFAYDIKKILYYYEIYYSRK